MAEEEKKQQEEQEEVDEYAEVPGEDVEIEEAEEEEKAPKPQEIKKGFARKDRKEILQEQLASWVPKTKLGKDVKAGKIKDIDEKVKVLCGAGVKNGKDVAKAIELGADGVLLASGIVKAKNKETVVRDLASGL